MKKFETKGRSRRQNHPLFRGGMKRMRCFLSVCLCTSMISTSIGTTTALADAVPLLETDGAVENDPNFVLEKENLSEALLKAAKGKPVKEEALVFQGEAAETYESLFQEDGSLFELRPDIKTPDGKVNLKVYARLDEKEDPDHYTITGEEEILFLLLNRSSEKEYGQIEVDGKLSGKVSILPSKELKKQIQDEETEAIEETGVFDSNDTEDKSNETAGKPEKEPGTEKPAESETEENVKESDPQEPAQDSENKNPVEEPENGGEAENPANEAGKGSEAEKPANDLENGAENSANEPEKSQEAGSGTEDKGKTDVPEKGDNPSNTDSGLENGKNDSVDSEAGDAAQVSRSDHFQMFLTAAAPATASEMQEEETSEEETNIDPRPDAQTEVELEDGAERLQGEAYESVLLKNTAAAAFVTTAAELGLSGSVDDAVYTVNTDSAVLTLTVPAGAFEEKIKLKAEEIQDGSEAYQALSDQIHEDGYRADTFTAFDVKFVNEAGEEVEPSEEVKVSIQFKKNADERLAGENLEETKILHIHEDVITELSEVEIQDSTEDSAKTAKLTFGVNEFSILLALNEAAVGVAEVNGTVYDTLEEAFAAAGDGDAVKVLKNCELSSAISVDKNLTLDLNEKAVKVKIVPEAKAVQTISAFAVAENVTFTVKNGLLGGSGSNADNRAIEANGGTVILQNTILAGFQALSGNGGAVLMNGGTLEAEGCNFGYFTREDNNYKEYSGQRNFAQSGGAVYTSQAAVKMEKCNVFYNSAIDENGTTGQYWFGGGALFADGGTVTLNENYFFYNTSKDYGGAIHLDAVQKAELTGNRIRNCHVYNHRITEMAARGGDGGAIYSRISKVVTLKNNTITGGTSMGNGAGLYVIGAADCVLTLEGNTISGNIAGQRGGGMKLDMDKNSQVNLISGLISENSSSGFGGGIDYTNHENPTLHLTNVLITGNQASRGAGIWSCPTSETEIYSTLGGAFYGNTATGSTGGISYSYEASGDEIRYEGVDTPDKFAIQSNPPSATTHISVSKRSLGGGVIQWYLDEAESRYQAGNPEADPAIYTNTNLSFGLHGELSEEQQKMASAEAQLVIRDNVSKRGGGIATNSPLVIGMEYADVAVEVTKKWTEETHPDHVYVALYRVGDASGEKVKLDSHVELNAENNWSASFADLPSKCVTNGEVEDCHYIVEEETVEGWKGSSSAEYDKENKTYKITLTNTPIQYGSLTVSKEVTGSGGKEKAFPFKVILQGDTALNGTYGDMEFVDNVATFTLKHGESKSAAGLPEGVAYTVEESGNEGYTVTKTGDVGTIVGGETAVVKFVNAMNGGENPNPNPNPNPTPDNNGGGSSGGHGAGGSSSRRGSSTTTSSGPAAEPSEPVTPVEPEPQPVVPAEGLPKTGDTDQMDVPMALMAVGMMAAAYVLMTGRKKTEE